ncbi:MAG TPA: thermonuclease family protein, partial [Candidatus Omnitrophota bacterium]|nr:thermonuclease family protein [Candidatus Omnitrophota bacterium]
KLIAIVDDRERSLLEKKIDQNNWSAEELGVRIKSRKFNTITVKEETASKQDLLTPKRGALYTYRLVQRPTLGWRITDSPLQLDLGFGVFRDVEPRVASRFAAEQIVESLKKDGTYSISASERTAKDLFTYAAYIERVIDADTLKVRVDLGFGIWHRETLRLRDIDSPEVGTKGGDAAKAFVQSLLKEADTIILHTTRSDKYDRYLADVFIGTDTFLNNLLLEEDHALRV